MISQQELQDKLQEANNISVENMQKVESELGKLREQVLTGLAKPKDWLDTVADAIGNIAPVVKLGLDFLLTMNDK